MRCARYTFLPVLLLAALFSQRVFAEEYTEEVERVIAIRSNSQLQITNNRGDIVIEGWAQDKIRLKLKRTATADNPEAAKKMLAVADVGHRVWSGNIEVFAEYGKNLTLEERLRERAAPKTRMEMTLHAPANLPLRVWAVNGKVILKGWKASLEIRSGSGPIDLEAVKGENVSVLCPSCAIQVKNVRGNFRCMGGSGSISIYDVEGDHTYVESETGEIQAERISGNQLYVSKSGAISLKHPKGHVEFHTQQAPFTLTQGEGYVSGKTTSGNITVGMRDWEFPDKALLESVSGRVQLGLPTGFSGEVDAWSLKGKVQVGLILRPLTGKGEKAAAGGQRVVGLAGEGGEQLRVFSESGDVSITSGNN